MRCRCAKIAGVGTAIVSKVVLALLTLPLACTALCTSRVEPVHGWMMSHHCLFARLAMHPPSRPIGVRPRPAEEQMGGASMRR
jgi:hypothetical protein